MNCEPKNERYMPHKIEPQHVAESELRDTELLKRVKRTASATNGRNALAELAERLDKGRWNLDVKDYDKASLIIAELAKVDRLYRFIATKDNYQRYRTELAGLISKCCAIAEEGVNNGKL